MAEESRPSGPESDEKFWLDRAAEARAVGKRMTLPETKRAMYSIAESYERLARYIRGRTDRSKEGS